MASDVLIERLLSQSIPEPNSGCWLWFGAISSTGYGHLTLGGRTVKAHRLSYEVFKGPIQTIDGVDSRGTCVVHSCDNPCCINPDHLELGTHADNMRQKRERSRVVNHPLLGELHQNSKLTAEKVRAIRCEAELGVKARQIAVNMGVHHATIHDVLTGRTWSHVPH